MLLSRTKNRPHLTGLLLLLLFPAWVAAEREVAPLESWLTVVRQSPYWVSKGTFANLKTIRRWVLSGESFCEVQERHILFDHRATFLGYIDNASDGPATQQKLNHLRLQLVKDGRVDAWAPGDADTFGYPFALSCHQPHAQLSDALARYSGANEAARLWGTWDGIQIGTKDDLVSLHKAIMEVYQDRAARDRVTMPETILSTLAGKALIESAGQKHAHSAANARGVMQLSVAALRDCGLTEEFYFHRLAQIDCALRLLEQNHRNLKPVFDETFGHLPPDKADALYDMLLLQAYHGGVGRISALLTEPDSSGAAGYFAKHHQEFTAGDIALGLIFHNLGRNDIGFASLYYVVDVAIATEAACQRLPDLPGCQQS